MTSLDYSHWRLTHVALQHDATSSGGVFVRRTGLNRRRSFVAAAAASVLVLLAGCATADLSVDSSARVSGTISIDLSKDSLASANVATVEDFQKIVETRLAGTPDAGRLFAKAVYTGDESNFNVTTTYSKASFDDSAKTYARVAGSRIAFSMDTSIFDPALLGLPSAEPSPDAASAPGTVDLSSATVTITVKFPGKLVSFSKAGATRVDARTVKWEGSASDLGVVKASSGRK